MFTNFVNPFTVYRELKLNDIEKCQKTILSCQNTKVLIVAAEIVLVALAIFLTFTGPIGIRFGLLLGAVTFVAMSDSYNVINNVQEVCDDVLKLKQPLYSRTEEGIKGYILKNTVVARHFF
ncbi:MAG TPA: hypothetical protein VIH61_02275 [Waddliaceae bacterium]